MDPAYYVAAGSLKARAYHLDVVANNLANADTVGYKTERAFFTIFNKAKDYRRHLPLTQYVNEGTIYPQKDLSFEQGPTKLTQRELDLALEGNAFFSIQTPQGMLLTRDGRFTLGTGGELMTLDGHLVMGRNGAITLSRTGGAPLVRSDGAIFQDDNFIDQLDLKSYADTAPIERAGWGRFTPGDAEEGEVTGRVLQGYLEQSATNMPNAMVEMIRLNRLFEMSQKIASTLANDLDARSISSIAMGQ
jgi:flagellar basal body rod protein FlgG